MNGEQKKLTQESYTANAAYFINKFDGPFSQITLSQLDTFIKKLQGKKILDAGCGTGAFAKWFLEKKFDVIGIDISEPLLSVAKSKGITTKHMDFEQITFPSETFDGIWAMSSLLHVPKQKMPQVLTSFHKILKKEAILFVALKEGTGEKIIADTPTTSRFFSFWTIDEFCKLTKDLFEVLDTQTDIVNNNNYLGITFRKR